MLRRSPLDHPALDVPVLTLLIDGDCGFCARCAEVLVRRSSTPIDVITWQESDVARFGLTTQQTAARVYLVSAGRAYGGHSAFAQILLSQRNLLPRAAGWAISVPPGSWLAALGYRVIARLRHRLPGGTPTCTPAQGSASPRRVQDF